MGHDSASPPGHAPTTPAPPTGRPAGVLKKRITGGHGKIHGILADCTADRGDLFAARGLEHLAKVKVSAEDRFVLGRFIEQWQTYVKQVEALDRRGGKFAKSPPELLGGSGSVRARDATAAPVRRE